jgi:hypothetical protein
MAHNINTLGVDWILPGRQRRFATSTKATSDLIVLVAEKGLTVRESIDHIHYDDEAQEILRKFVDSGHGDAVLADLVA